MGGYSNDLRYSPNKKGKLMQDVWQIPSINNMARERKGYPTQKPLKLLEKIIKASIKEGDVILDPFCGCATTCITSEKLNNPNPSTGIFKLKLKNETFEKYTPNKRKVSIFLFLYKLSQNHC